MDERERANFAKLTREDEEFRKKILDLHRKLSDVDEGYRRSPDRKNRPGPELERLRELESVARRAEENFERNSLEFAVAEHKERVNALRVREILKRDEESGRRKRQDVEIGRKRYAEMWKGSEEREPKVNFEETNFLKRLRMRKRGLLSFLGGRSSELSQEERVSRIMTMYFAEKEAKSQNTISIQHTSRDRRFWKLRNRRKSSSA